MSILNYIAAEWPEIQIALFQHIKLIGIALSLAIVSGVPAGIYITSRPRLASIVLYIAGVIMTIPSVALFGLLIPVLSLIGQGVGIVPAVIAIFLYAQLPIIRNTYTAIKEVDPAIREAGKGMGMTPRQILFRVELPLALPVIVAGVRIAVVINIGIAAIAAYIGAGGLGRFIFRGISRSYDEMIITGAIFVSILALLADFLLGRLENTLLSEGLKRGDTG